MADTHPHPVSPSPDVTAEEQYSLYVRSVMGDDEAKQEVLNLPDNVREPLMADILASGGTFS